MLQNNYILILYTRIIIEFKKVDKFENETLDTALKTALKQIDEKKYDTVLI